ncbi:hypothetical protein PABG_05841 [Paracoccidioides brasiliensis Pb03]|nr:hypothetical protein PABG_05841 [Paracoccidioides brasiliensis Pb03]
MNANNAGIGNQRPPVPPQHLPPQYSPQAQMVPGHAGPANASHPLRAIDPNQFSGFPMNPNQQLNAMVNQMTKLHLDTNSMGKVHESFNHDFNDKEFRDFPDDVATWYEGWTLFPTESDSSDSAQTWSQITRTRIHLSQEELIKEKSKQKKKSSRNVAEQYNALGKGKRSQIDRLIEERKRKDGDIRFEWTFVFIFANTKNVGRRGLVTEYITTSLDVILMRKVRPGITLPTGNYRVANRDTPEIFNLDPHFDLKEKSKAQSYPSEIRAHRLQEPGFGQENPQHHGGIDLPGQRQNAHPIIVNPSMGMVGTYPGEQHGGFPPHQEAQPRIPLQVHHIHLGQHTQPNGVQIINVPKQEAHGLPLPPPPPPAAAAAAPHPPVPSHPQSYPHPQYLHHHQHQNQHQHQRQHQQQSQSQPQVQEQRLPNFTQGHTHGHIEEHQSYKPSSAKIINMQKVPSKESFGGPGGSSVDDNESVIFDEFEDASSATTEDSLFYDENDQHAIQGEGAKRIQRRGSETRGMLEPVYRYHQRPTSKYPIYKDHRRPDPRYTHVSVDIYPENSTHKRRPTNRLSRSASVSYPGEPRLRFTHDENRRDRNRDLPSANRGQQALTPSKRYSNTHIQDDIRTDREWERNQWDREHSLNNYMLNKRREEQWDNRNHRDAHRRWEQGSAEVHPPHAPHPPQRKSTGGNTQYPAQLPREDRSEQYARMAELNRMSSTAGGAGGRQDQYGEDDAFNDPDPFGREKRDRYQMGHGQLDRERDRGRMDHRRHSQMEPPRRNDYYGH